MNLATRLATARTPSCFDSFQTRLLPGRDDEAIYRIACRCGSENGRIVSEYDRDEDCWSDPLVFECVDCGTAAAFFDSRRHGYDAVLNHFSAYPPRTRDEIVLCDSCGSDRHRLTASLTWQFEDEEVEKDWTEEERRKMTDVFDSASFDLTCAQCGHGRHLAAFECA